MTITVISEVVPLHKGNQKLGERKGVISQDQAVMPGITGAFVYPLVILISLNSMHSSRKWGVGDTTLKGFVLFLLASGIFD
jgi:hypothetical protein